MFHGGFLNWALDWTECSASHSAQLMSGETVHDTHATRGWLRPEVSLMSSEQTCAFQDMTSFVLFLPDILHTFQIESLGN